MNKTNIFAVVSRAFFQGGMHAFLNNDAPLAAKAHEELVDAIAQLDSSIPRSEIHERLALLEGRSGSRCSRATADQMLAFDERAKTGAPPTDVDRALFGPQTSSLEEANLK